MEFFFFFFYINLTHYPFLLVSWRHVLGRHHVSDLLEKPTRVGETNVINMQRNKTIIQKNDIKKKAHHYRWPLLSHKNIFQCKTNTLLFHRTLDLTVQWCGTQKAFLKHNTSVSWFALRWVYLTALKPETLASSTDFAYACIKSGCSPDSFWSYSGTTMLTLNMQTISFTINKI